VLLSQRLLPHQSKTLSQLHGTPHDACDGQEREKEVTVPDLERVCGRIGQQGYRVASALSIDGGGRLIDLHVAPRLTRTQIRTSMPLSQPSIWVHLLGERRHAWQGGKGNTRWVILTGAPLMRALPVGMLLGGLCSFFPRVAQRDVSRRQSAEK
jgi:hypothetical protein